MSARIGIRLEDKNKWEARTPLIPLHVKELTEQHDIDVTVQASTTRAYTADEYLNAGTTIAENVSECATVFAIKEIPLEALERGKTYVFFSHTIKGQKDNMPMLQRILDLDCQLIDYEKIVDESGRRLVFFGDYAGMAGMIDTLWALGQRLMSENATTPFCDINQAYQYANLDQAKAAISKVGQIISQKGLQLSSGPLICGFAGYGNVSRGAQEVFDLLPVQELSPDELTAYEDFDPHLVYKVVFKEQDMVKPIDPGADFKLQDYYDHPERYRSVFETYLPHMTVLVNGIYWTERYPRLVTRANLKALFQDEKTPRLRVIGDISCDVNGAIECNVRATSPGNPIYVYDPVSEQAQDGHRGPGVVVLAVDNLPCELPRESSAHFSSTLLPFVPEIANANCGASLDESGLSTAIKRAVITWRGQLTPDFQYLARFL